MKLDHLLWGAPDLDEGRSVFEQLTGARVSPGGSHPGEGTRNNLMSLGDGIYFEIISVDPAQKERGKLARAVRKLTAPAMMGLAARDGDLEDVRKRAASVGLTPGEVVRKSRTRPDGATMSWSFLDLNEDCFDGSIPIVLDWQKTTHPSRMPSAGCSLKSLAVLTPEPGRLRRIYDALRFEIDVEFASSKELRATISSPKGEVILTGAIQSFEWYRKDDSH